MTSETRVIKSMICGGLTVVALGLLMVWLGYADWWFKETHLLGSFGIEMVVYGVWHLGFYRYDRGSFKNSPLESKPND